MHSDRLEQPWSAVLSFGEHQLISYVLVVAGLAFLAGFIRSWLTRTEVGPRYRSAVTARLGMLAVALASYAVLVVTFHTAYERTAAGWVPTDDAVGLFAARYMGWTVSLPLLTIELLAVCAIVGVQARRSRTIALLASAAMIFCGFLGGVVINGGTDVASFLLWAVISIAFWVVTTVVLVRAVAGSRAALTPESQALLTRATTVLLAGWVVYPIAYFLPLVGMNGELATAIVLILTIADVTIKLMFSTQIHRVAKLRTAEDVRAGIDVHPESVWISSVKLSDAGLPREVYLAEGEAVHDRRRMPAPNTAAATVQPSDPRTDDGSVF